MNIDTKVLQHYVNSARIPYSSLLAQVNHLDLFLSGEKQPTFTQLVNIAKKLNIPTGLLLLKHPVELKKQRLEFRSSGLMSLERMSEELRDIILEMEDKQAFLREEIDFTLDFIKMCSRQDGVRRVADIVRRYLQVDIDFQKSLRKGTLLHFLRTKINEMGVFVFLNGKVGDNTHRPLRIEEFRGFVISDNKAPIIFINQKDESESGKVFTLIHELVHLFLGEDEILTENGTNYESNDAVEIFVNQVTAEILVPEESFLEVIADSTFIEFTNDAIRELADDYKVSRLMIVRRLYDLGKINQKDYRAKTQQLMQELRANQRDKKSSGGDYANNLKFRVDKKFFAYVQQALQQNKISYTEAFRLIGVSYKGYKTLAKEV